MCFSFCVGEGNESQSSRAVGPCWLHVYAQPEALVLGCAASHAGVRPGLSGREEWEVRVGWGCESACCRALRLAAIEGGSKLFESSPCQSLRKSLKFINRSELILKKSVRGEVLK